MEVQIYWRFISKIWINMNKYNNMNEWMNEWIKQTQKVCTVTEWDWDHCRLCLSKKRRTFVYTYSHTNMLRHTNTFTLYTLQPKRSHSQMNLPGSHVLNTLESTYRHQLSPEFKLASLSSVFKNLWILDKSADNTYSYITVRLVKDMLEMGSKNV